VHIVYIDDSGDQEWAIFSALAIPAELWRDTFEKVKEFRQALKHKDGILLRKELHAVDFIPGRGRPAGPKRAVLKHRRSEIFRETLTLTAALPEAKSLNAAGPRRYEDRLFERLLVRIHVCMRKSDPQSHALIISDKGKEVAYTNSVASWAPSTRFQVSTGDGREASR
jgi:hypothetical protein